jgi:hypothetical protein
MTWTVRLYDKKDIEIAWVKIENNRSYSYEITHTNSKLKDNFLYVELRNKIEPGLIYLNMIW